MKTATLLLTFLTALSLSAQQPQPGGDRSRQALDPNRTRERDR